MDTRRYKKILIIKPSSLGDIVHSLPTLKVLRHLFPKAFISWLVKEEWAPILAGNPYLDEILSFPFTSRAIPQMIRTIRERRFDLVLDLQGLFRSAMLGLLSGAPIRIGFDNAREGARLFYTERIRVPSPEIHAVDRYLSAVGINGFVPSTSDFYIGFDQADTQYIKKMLSEDGLPTWPLIAINPFARWETKVWRQERFASLANLLIDKMDARVVLIGSYKDNTGRYEGIPLGGGRNELASGYLPSEQREREGEAPQALPVEGATQAPIIDMMGKTSLRQLAALLKEVDLLITNDSGPMHIAAALGTPVAAIFGPTDPKRTGPYGDMHRVIRGGAECSPCFKKRCSKPTHLCMEAISVEMVLEEVSMVLRGSNIGSIGTGRREDG